MFADYSEWDAFLTIAWNRPGWPSCSAIAAILALPYPRIFARLISWRC